MTTAWILANFVIVTAYILLSIGNVFALRTLPMPRWLLVPFVTAISLFFLACGLHHAHLVSHVATNQQVADELITLHGLVFDIFQAVAAPITFTMLLIALHHMNVRIHSQHDFVAAEAESDDP